MKRNTLWALFLLITGSSLAEPVKKIDRWKELMVLISQEMKILDNAKNKGPELQYRLLELHSERLKLIHEKNNKEFLERSKTENLNKDKESLFVETRNYYKFTKDFGAKIIKNFPTTKRRAEILFAMALNSRDYGNDNITEKYLLETISLVNDPHHSLRHHAETALADYYYNEKRYQDAIGYYLRVIKKTEDEWLPKHYFNLSWCYLKVREFDKAIKAIREAYTLSKNKVYVNIKDQVLDNVGSFYVYAGRPMEGLDFYLKNEPDPLPYLMSMAQKTSEKGHMKETEEILSAAQKIIDKNKWVQYQEELYHSYFDFYRHYNRFADHESIARILVAYYAKAQEEKDPTYKTTLKDDSIEKMRSAAGFLQVKLSKNMKEVGGSYKEEEMSILLSYFSHLIVIDGKRKVEYLYFRGETYYSVKRFQEAAKAYVECVDESKLAKNNDYARKGLNSLLALTALEVIEKNLNKKYLIYAYSEHIGIWPIDEMSEKIYPKLFEVYRDSSADESAVEVVKKFNKAYPVHLKDQQVLMTKVLDLYIEKKNTVKLASVIHQFRSGFLSFSSETIEKVEITLGNMLFLEYQELAKQGKKELAASGFETIYENKLYTNKVKSLSAFFAALTYLELGETEISYKWHVNAYAIMTDEEKLAKRDEQLKMAERTYKLQDFKTSYKISEFLLKKFCSLKDGMQNRLYEIAIMTSLVENEGSDAEEIVSKYSNCISKKEIHDSAINQIYSHYVKTSDLRSLKAFVSKHEHLKAPYLATIQKWYWEKSDDSLKSDIVEEFKSIKTTETLTWVKEIHDYEKAKLYTEELAETVIWDKPEFDGDAYNKALEGHLLKVQKIKNDYQYLLSSNQIDLVMLATRMFANVYSELSQKIRNIRPEGMDAQTYKHFSLAMKDVALQFKNVSKQFEKQLKKALKSRDSLNWGSRAVASIEDIENPVFSNHTGLTMDKSRGE